jgi:hypothetical protein
MQPTENKAYTNGRQTAFPKNLCPKKGEKIERKEETRDNDGLGPGAYQLKMPNQTPIYSFGTRFTSSIRNKDHLRPTKVDGPGIKNGRPKTYETRKTTFGSSARNFIDLPKETPAPNKYRPVHFTEASHNYSIPKAQDNYQSEVHK